MKRLSAVLLFFTVLCISTYAQADCGDKDTQKPQQGQTTPVPMSQGMMGGSSMEQMSPMMQQMMPMMQMCQTMMKQMTMGQNRKDWRNRSAVRKEVNVMWWNTPGGWGPMYGWWIMPFFGIIFLVLMLLIVSRFFGSGGGFCGRPPADRDSSIDELRKEIKALREEIRDLKNK